MHLCTRSVLTFKAALSYIFFRVLSAWLAYNYLFARVSNLGPVLFRAFLIAVALLRRG